MEYRHQRLLMDAKNIRASASYLLLHLPLTEKKTSILLCIYIYIDRSSSLTSPNDFYLIPLPVFYTVDLRSLTHTKDYFNCPVFHRHIEQCGHLCRRLHSSF